MSRRDAALRWSILTGIAAAALLLMAWGSQRPVNLAYSGFTDFNARVSLFWEPDCVTVRVDDREEKVPQSQLANSEIYREALARIPAERRPATAEIRWRRVISRWIFLTALTWWMLFRVWQPRRPYLEVPVV